MWNMCLGIVGLGCTAALGINEVAECSRRKEALREEGQVVLIGQGHFIHKLYGVFSSGL